MPETLTEETRDKLRELMEQAIQEAMDEDNVAAAVDAVMGRVSWNRVALQVAEDVLTEESTDKLILAFEPAINDLVQQVLGRLGFLANLPGLDLTEHVKGVLDNMLPELALNPLRQALAEAEEPVAPEEPAEPTEPAG